MSENLQNLLRESLLNNSYDYSSMHGALRMTWENSYSYLYNLQKNYVEFEDLEYISNDTDKSFKRIGRLYNDKLFRACFDVNYDFIHICDREEFHESEFYFNEFTFYDMVYNPSIFKKIPIIIVDGQCLWDYKLRINKKIISVILPFKRDFVIDLKRNPETDELIYLDHNIRILVIDNIYYYEFESVSAIGIDYNNGAQSLWYNFYDTNNAITKNGVTVRTKTKWKLGLDVTDILKNNNINSTDGLFIATINKNVENKKNLKEFFSSGILISSDVSMDPMSRKYTCDFLLGDDLHEKISDQDNKYTIHVLYVNNLHGYALPISRHDINSEWYTIIDGAQASEILYGEHDSSADNRMTKDIICDENGECNVFMIQNNNNNILTPYAMPIPVENLIVIKLDQEDNATLMINTETVRLYYPNIYRIVDPDRQPGDRYHVYYFYHNATFLQYTPMYDYFYRFLQIRYNERPIEEIIDFIYRGVADLSSFTEEQANELMSTFIKIMEYQYFNHKYGEVDFLKRYKLLPQNIDKEVVECKDETLKEWINVNPFVLRDYVIEQDKLYSSVYHLWTNTLDLSTHLRTNTFEESKHEINAFLDNDDTYFTEYGKRYDQTGQYIGMFSVEELNQKLSADLQKKRHKIQISDDWYELNGEYYVFSFRNDDTIKNNLLDARVFVDGLHVDDLIQEKYYFTDYFYIPVELVTDDSYIEIEIFPTYKYGERVKFESMDDTKTITLLEPADQIFPTAQDLFYMEPSGHLIGDEHHSQLVSTDAKGIKETVKISSKQSITIGTDRPYYDTTIYSNELFEITAKYKDGDFVVKTTDPEKPVKFTRLSTFEIKPLRNYVVNKDLYVGISKIPNYINYTIDREGYPYIALVQNENNFKFNIDYLRIFRNGRLLPRQKYCFFSSFFFPRIQFTDYMYPGDVIHIDITPYRYKEIYYQERLVRGQTLINLKDVITKPFDIRYYDVYMNGRKLGLNSVWTISPWEITLTNLLSLSNLQIFEKERDWEYFGTNYKEAQYYYTIDDLFGSSFITEHEKNQIIKEMIEEAKEPECNIKPPVDIEPPIDFTDDRQYPHVSEFYFNELIPKTFVDPDTKQFDDDIMKEEYTTVDDVYRVHTVDSYRTENEKERRKNYVDALALNPDEYIEGANDEHLTYVYCVGHPDKVDNELLSQTPNNYYEEEEIDNAY